MLDTHILIWIAVEPGRLSADFRSIVESEATELIFSVASIWEVKIKSMAGRPDFTIDAASLRSGLIDAGLRELDITSEHAIAVGQLPPLHGDPFDRILLAQAVVEDAVFVTADSTIARYPGPIRFVG